jgi:RNA methyltransferase, TrmH family
VITSAANPRLRLVRKLASRRQREKLGLFVCEGEDLVEAGLAAGLEPVDVLVAGEDVEPGLLAGVSTLAHPPRQVAIFRRADLPRLDDPRTRSVATGLALWRVGDPGNLGTILRAADGLGPAFVAPSAGCADPTGPKALRASMGAVFRVPLGRFEEAPGRLIALVAHGGEPLHQLDLRGPVTFVLGAEREGVPESVAASCDARGSIGLEPGAESLNVALAAALALYERRRSRGPG